MKVYSILTDLDDPAATTRLCYSTPAEQSPKPNIWWLRYENALWKATADGTQWQDRQVATYDPDRRLRILSLTKNLSCLWGSPSLIIYDQGPTNGPPRYSLVQYLGFGTRLSATSYAVPVKNK